MPSSTSPSEPQIHHGALPAGLRLTASDRPGQAQPVPTRDIPLKPWRKMALVVAGVVLVLTAGWEVAMRHKGLRPGDIDDSEARWAELREGLGGHDQVAMVSDSRLLFDTDLDRFTQLTGKHPVPLGVVGSSAFTLLKDVASDKRFNGLLLVGLADTQYFGRPGRAKRYIADWHKQRLPSARTRLWLGDLVESWLAFPADGYRLSEQVTQLDRGWRGNNIGPYNDVWKLSESDRRREYRMWPEVETNAFLREHAIMVWNDFKPEPGDPKFDVAKTLRETAEAVAQIRARGGDVVFIRPPSAPQIRVNEEAAIPKAKGWEGILAASHSRGIHVDEFGNQPWNLPERSHLSRACASVFTDLYVRRLAQLTNRIALVPGAPPPLKVADCVGVGPGAPARGTGPT